MILTGQPSVTLDDIQEVLGGQHYGHYLAVCCPFHGDHSPSMMVYEDTYTCKSCGAHGRTEFLLKRLNKSSFVPSFGYEESEPIYNPFHRWLKTESLSSLLRRSWQNGQLNPDQLTYLIDVRKISLDDCRRLGIGVLGDFFTFPVLDIDRKVVGAFARAKAGIGTRYFVPKGQNPNLLYSPDWRQVVDSTTMFVTFGAIDAYSVSRCGFACVSTLSGKNLDWTALDPFRKRIIIIPDHGEDKEANRLASMLDWRGRVCQFPYPDKTKDMNDVYKENPDLIIETLEKYTNGYNVASSVRNSNRIDHQRTTV